MSCTSCGCCKPTCEAWDRKEQAREALVQVGLTYMDSKGRIWSRPEVQVERDSRIAFLRALRRLNLAVEPPESGLRPPTLFRR